MQAPTAEAIQVLIDRPKGEGMLVSCYANTSVSGGIMSLWPRHLKNEVSAIERRLAGDRPALERFARNVEIIRRTLADPAVPHSRGMAIFSAADQGLLRAFVLGVPVPDRLVVDEEAYLVPLLETMHRHRRYLVVVADSHRGRLYEASWGHTRLMEAFEADVPRRQKSAGERWGKQQATIARHREDHILHFRKELARAVARAWPEAPFRGVILLADGETAEGLRAELPPALATEVVHTAPYCWAREEPHPDDVVQAVLDEARHAHDARLVADLERRLREHHLVAAGPREVIEALRNGQVGYPGYLVLGPDQGQMGARCTRCRSLFPDPQAACPYCQGPCDTVNLWQELLLFAMRHDIPAHTVENRRTLSEHGGVAAVLSRAEPWMPAGEAAAATAAGSG